MKDNFDLYLEDIEKYSPLSVEEEQKYGKILTDEKSSEEEKIAARNTIVNHNLKYVVKVARIYKGKSGYSGIPMEELVGAGNVGLMVAVERYDWKVGRFLTYADFWIKLHIQKARNEIANVFNKPNHVVKAIVHVNNVKGELEQLLGRPPYIEEIAEAMDGELTINKIEEILMQSSRKVVSLDASPQDAEDDDMSYSEVVAGDGQSPLEVTLEKERNQVLREMLAEIPYASRRTIELSFGLTQEGEKTLEQISEILYAEGVCNEKGEKYTKQNVSLLKAKGLELIKKNRKLMEVLAEYMKLLSKN